MSVHTNTGELAENCVPGGWVKELSSARSLALKEKTAGANLRCARAASKLRQFDKVAKYCKVGLALNPTRGEKTQLVRLARVAKKDLRIAGRVDIKELKDDLVDKVLAQGLSVDNCQLYYPGVLYTNLNFLQASAMMGDIRTMELTIALGAALDFKVRPGFNTPAVPPRPAPTGITALTLSCAALVTMHKTKLIGEQFGPEFDTTTARVEECCVLLVQLGADCSARFKFTKSDLVAAYVEAKFLCFCDSLGLNGKSVKQLAQESGSLKLIRAIESVSTKELALRNVLCRCGSRMPWVECHAGQKFDSFCLEESHESGTKLLWRYSPLARCSCNKTNDKTHFKCCWNSNERMFQDDHTGQIAKRVTIPVSAAYGRAMESWIKFREIESGGARNAKLFPDRDENGRAIEGKGISEKKHKQMTLDSIRRTGNSPIDAPYVTKREKWDMDVIAGTFQNLDDYFMWTELHWMIPKSELLARTKEWNDALQMYCDQADLHGEAREKVIELHKAESVAPCGNPGCSNRERKIKEFKACSRCRTVAYCSKDCQRVHWQAMHKATCSAC